MSPRVRRAVPRDAATLAAVQDASWKAAFAGLMPDDYLASLDVAAFRATWEECLAGPVRPSSGILVAEDDAQVVGYARYYATDDADDDPARVGMLGSLYTLPAVWGTGVGKALMTEVLGALASAGYAESTLWVLEGNGRARNFYRRQGWSEDGGREESRDDGFLITKLRYRLSLSGA
ncbi:GNAT family N-acetyltransferase [Sphaerisporangium sp. NPDC051017]|uniref:GNAT family N-acetyltransferase n=1 Tax=Sphaerisporangium sp. NPDC051017 TaxID=3154636 RepID=UPI003423F2E4